MPIQLTTKWVPGSVDPGAEYAEAKIVRFCVGLGVERFVQLDVEFGDTVDGAWVPGKTGNFTVYIEDYTTVFDNVETEVTDYTDFATANADLMNQVAAVLYAKVQELHPEKTAGAVA